MTEHNESETHGIVVGGFLGFKHLHGIGSFFTTATYGHYCCRRSRSA